MIVICCSSGGGSNEIAFGQQRVVFMALFGKQIDNSTKRHADK